MVSTARVYGRLKFAIAGALVALSFFMTFKTLPLLPLRDGQPPQAQRFPPFEDPGREYFYAASEVTELSHSVLYHGLGRSIDNARRADVLFIGNSRLGLGLREEFLVPRAEALGVRLFSLGVGHGERVRFALEVMVKHDLRPAVVVISGGPHIFHDSLSRVAQEAMSMTRWDAVKQWIETSGAWHLRTRLHAMLPKLDFFERPLHSPWVIYRSVRTGWWRPVAEPKWRYDVQRVPVRQDALEGLLPTVRGLRDALRSRGAVLVLTLVPYAKTQDAHLSFLAERLGIPVVLPSLEGVTVADGSHLNRESAARVSSAFWETFVRLPEVRTALSLKSIH